MGCQQAVCTTLNAQCQHVNASTRRLSFAFKKRTALPDTMIMTAFVRQVTRPVNPTGQVTRSPSFYIHSHPHFAQLLAVPSVRTARCHAFMVGMGCASAVSLDIAFSVSAQIAAADGPFKHWDGPFKHCTLQVTETEGGTTADTTPTWGFPRALLKRLQQEAAPPTWAAAEHQWDVGTKSCLAFCLFCHKVLAPTTRAHFFLLLSMSMM